MPLVGTRIGEQKGRTKDGKPWSLQDAKSPKEQERVRKMLNPFEQEGKKKPGPKGPRKKVEKGE